MEKRPKKNNNIQLIWGAALTLVGIGVIIRIHQVMPQLEKMEPFSYAPWFVWFCFYLMGGILIGGGLKKLYHYFRPAQRTHGCDDDMEQVENDADR